MGWIKVGSSLVPFTHQFPRPMNCLTAALRPTFLKHGTLHVLGISDLAEKYQYHASGGQKQRVAAARALSTDLAVCFADEPTGNLDSKSSSNIMEMMTQMNTQKHCTILMVTHDAFAASYCQKIIFIKDGKINVQIQSSGDRKVFFDKILETLGLVRGDKE